MRTEINTDTVSPEQRVEFWRQHMVGLFKAEHRIEQRATEDFRARLQLYTVDRLHFTESAGTAHKSIVTSAHEDAFAVIIPLAGVHRLIQDEREALLETSAASAITLCNLAHPYELVATTEYHRLVIHVPGKECREIFPAFHQLTAVPIAADEGPGALLLAMARTLHQWIAVAEAQPATATAIADAMLSLLRAMVCALPKDHETMSSRRLEVYHRERIRAYIRANLRSQLSVESIAQAVELSLRYVHSLFENESQSLMKWVWAERLERCRKDLTVPALRNHSVSEIAYSWGFNDPAHFSRTFRANFGVTPVKYRQKALESVV